MTGGRVIDVEATVRAMGTPEEEAGRELAHTVVRERERWLAAWHGRLVDPALARVEMYPEATVGCSPGSCFIELAGRTIAKFVVRYREETMEVDFEVDWPGEE